MFNRRIFVSMLCFSCGLNAATLVSVKPIQEVLEPSYFQAPALVVNDTHPAISAEVAGVLESIHVLVGERVERGEVLFQQDCRDLQLQLKQQESNRQALASEIKLAKQQLERVKTLRKTGSASVEQLNQRQSDVVVMSARIQAQDSLIYRSKLNTERCQIKAPFDGVVTEHLASAGGYLNTGVPVLKLLSEHSIEVSAQLQPEQIASLQISPSILLSVSDRDYSVTVRSFVPFINESARTQEVRLRFVDEKALTGAVGEVKWLSDAPNLPAEFLVKRGSELGIMVAEKGKARFIKLDHAFEGQVTEMREYADDLLLIVQGQYILNDGDEVEVQRLEADNVTTSAQ